MVTTGQVLDYCGEETIINLGSPLSGLYFIITGHVELRTPGPAAKATDLRGTWSWGNWARGNSLLNKPAYRPNS